MFAEVYILGNQGGCIVVKERPPRSRQIWVGFIFLIKLCKKTL